MAKYVTFGEIMARMEPSDFRRIRQALPGSLDVTFAGSEANVAASLAYFGEDAAFVTALPDNALADACVGALRNMGVDVSGILRTEGGRLGLYFVETGANQRPSRVIYDRAASAICLAESSGYDWQAAFAGASWFHVSGITPAVSKTAAEATLESVKRAKEAGLTVSCDLNFRKKLWRWEQGSKPKELARRVMKEILPYVDLVGGGDAFAAGLIYALNDPELNEPADAVAFAAAASCLCHSIRWDFNFSSREEVLTLMGGDVSGRVKR